MIRESRLDLQHAYEPARLFVGGSSEYIKLATAPVTAAPLTMAVWARFSTIVGNGYPISISDASVINHQFLLAFSGGVGGDPIRFGVRAGGAVAWAATTTGYPARIWTHACGVEIAFNSRAAYINGGSVGTNVAARTPAGIDVIDIGRLGDSSPDGYFDGDIFWPCVWNVVLTAAEIAALGNRQRPIPPWKIRPESIVAMPHMGTLRDPYMRAPWVPSGTKPANPPWVWRPRRGWHTRPVDGILQVYDEILGPRLLRRVVSWHANTDGRVGVWFDGREAPPLCGLIDRLVTVPSVANPPTANYDVTLTTPHDTDLLDGDGADRSATAVETAWIEDAVGATGQAEVLGNDELHFEVAGAGACGAGVAVLYVIQP